MAPDWLDAYLLAKPETTKDFPFDQVTPVYKVKGKVFAILGDGKTKDTAANESPAPWLNLKCDPDEALMLRDIFPAVKPGYHMNKKHWNTVVMDGSVPQGEVERMIDNSFMLVVQKMSKKDQTSILVQL